MQNGELEALRAPGMQVDNALFAVSQLAQTSMRSGEGHKVMKWCCLWLRLHQPPNFTCFHLTRLLWHTLTLSSMQN